MNMSTKTALITGATSGIGEALTKQLIVEHDYTVYALGRNASKLESLRKTYSSAIKPIACDFDQIDRLSIALEPVKPGLNLLVNCATTLEPLGNITSIPYDKLEQAIRVNMLAPFVIIQMLLPKMAEQARILNISTRAAHRAIPNLGPHCISKAALSMLTQSLRMDLAKHHVLINELMPGVVDTPGQQSIRNLAPDEYPIVHKFRDYLNKGQVLTPMECANRIAQVLTQTSNEEFNQSTWSFYKNEQEAETWIENN